SIRTKIVHASELPAPQTEDATAKNIHMVRSLGGDTYLSGQGGHDYLDESQFTDVRLVYDAFTPTPYPQLFGEFIPNLAAIDAVWSESRKALRAGGGKGEYFLGKFPIGSLVQDWATVGFVDDLIRTYSIDTVISHHHGEAHQDHIAAQRIATAAARRHVDRL